MDTSTLYPENSGMVFGDKRDPSRTLEQQHTKAMTGTILFSSPIKRALKGFMSLLSGEIESEPRAREQAFFEKLQACEHPGNHQGFNRFQRALRRVRHSSHYEPTRSAGATLGTYGGRPVIGERGHINGGIYIGVVPQEAIVVDDKHGELDRLYNEMVVRLSEVSLERTLEENEILPEIAALVVRRLKFDEKLFDSICAREGILPDDKVALDMFLFEGVGVARHQVLCVAYLIERLKARNLLHGFASIDGISTHLMGRDERLTYTSPRGYLFVFDPLKIHQSVAA